MASRRSVMEWAGARALLTEQVHQIRSAGAARTSWPAPAASFISTSDGEPRTSRRPPGRGATR
eukprot:10552554-Alexandrium_andersonii.AAC.1